MDLNASYAQLTFNPPPELAAASPMTLVGSTASGDITAGWLVDMADTIVSSPSLQPATPGMLRQVIGRGAKPKSARDFALADRGQVTSSEINGVPVRLQREASGMIVAEDVQAFATGRLASGANATSSTQSRHTRRYRKDAKRWVLIDDVSDLDSEDAHAKHHHRVATSFRNVRYFVNPAKDSLRRVTRPTTDWIPLPSSAPVVAPAGGATRSVSATLAPGHSRRMVVCDDICQRAYSPTDPYRPPNAYPVALGSPPPCSPDNVAFTVADPAAADVNILYQHGFHSTAQTWCQGSEYVRMKLRVGYELRHTLQWRASYEDQAGTLNDRFTEDLVDRPGSYVLVGHSNGGRVNRYMAQSRNGANVRAVVTLSSPHAGAYLANVDQTVLAAALGVPLAYAVLGCDLSNTFVCSNVALFSAQVLAVAAPILVQAAIPVTREMGTNAPFAQIINGRGDVGYATAGVQNRLWDRWTPWRLVGDNNNCDAVSLIDCDAISGSYVRTADRVYHDYLSFTRFDGRGVYAARTTDWPSCRSYCAGLT